MLKYLSYLNVSMASKKCEKNQSSINVIMSGVSAYRVGNGGNGVMSKWHVLYVKEIISNGGVSEKWQYVNEINKENKI